MSISPLGSIILLSSAVVAQKAEPKKEAADTGEDLALPDDLELELPLDLIPLVPVPYKPDVKPGDVKIEGDFPTIPIIKCPDISEAVLNDVGDALKDYKLVKVEADPRFKQLSFPAYLSALLLDVKASKVGEIIIYNNCAYLLKKSDPENAKKVIAKLLSQSDFGFVPPQAPATAPIPEIAPLKPEPKLHKQSEKK